MPGPDAAIESIDDDIVCTIAINIAHRRRRPIPLRARHATGRLRPTRQFRAIMAENMNQIVRAAFRNDDLRPRLIIQISQGHTRRLQQRADGEIRENTEGLGVPIAIEQFQTVVVPSVDLAAGQHDFILAITVHVPHHRMAAGFVVKVDREALPFGRCGRLPDEIRGERRHPRRIDCGHFVIVARQLGQIFIPVE